MVFRAIELLPLGVMLGAVGCCVGDVDTTDRLGAPLDWIAPPHCELVHLNAGRSVGTGGVFPVVEGGEFVVVGIVGGGTGPATTLRGSTAKFGKFL
jgi:hypothetical protein